MRSSTAQNHLDSVIKRLDSVFRCALFDKPSSKLLACQMSEAVIGYKSYEILPDWVKERIQIHRMSLLERIRRDYTIQLYVLENGDKIVTTKAWDAFTEDTRESIRQGAELPIKTFWLDVTETCANDGTVTRISRPTDRVYFQSQS